MDFVPFNPSKMVLVHESLDGGVDILPVRPSEKAVVIVPMVSQSRLHNFYARLCQ